MEDRGYSSTIVSVLEDHASWGSRVQQSSDIHKQIVELASERNKTIMRTQSGEKYEEINKRLNNEHDRLKAATEDRIQDIGVNIDSDRNTRRDYFDNENQKYILTRTFAKPKKEGICEGSTFSNRERAFFHDE